MSLNWEETKVRGGRGREVRATSKKRDRGGITGQRPIRVFRKREASVVVLEITGAIWQQPDKKKSGD